MRFLLPVKYMLLRILIFTILLTMTVFSQTPPIEPGVSQTLAKWRAANYSDVRYKLNLTLEKQSPTLKGTIEIRVKLKTENGKSNPAEAAAIILDWRKIRGKENLSTVSNVSLNGKPAKFEEVNEHLVFKEKVVAGENIVKLDFTSPIAASGAAVTRYVDKEDGAEYVYSLFVPSDASTAFPVFDQPDLKARFSLQVIAPNEWQVVSNTPLDLSKASKQKKNTVTNEARLFTFVETKPISTYVFAFTAGEFSVFTDKKSSNIPPVMLVDLPQGLAGLVQDIASNRIYVRKSQAEKFKPHAAETFRLNREAVKYLEDYFAYKFPFPKYDLVLIPEFPFGGMEHAGATFLRESSVIFPSEPTANDYISRANLIFHEAAHQWFGDTVTMKWFDDLWLKEGFAEFMAYKTLEKVLPEYNAWKAFYERNKPLAYLTDSTKGTTPIYQEIPNLSAAKSAYGNIVYRKAPSFLKQAEFYLGEKEFQSAVRAFLKKYEFKNAEWTDLVREFQEAKAASIDSSNIDANSKESYVELQKRRIKSWAETWVKEKGVRVIKVIRGRNPSQSEVKMETPEEDLRWMVGFKVLKIFSDGSPGLITGIDNEFLVAKKDVVTQFYEKSGRFTERDSLLIFPNYQDYGYGIFLLDEKSRDYVLANIQNEKDAFLRSMMWGSLWDSVREAELDPKTYVELAHKNLLNETDDLTIQTILNRVSTAMSYYLADAQRDALAPKVESLALAGMLRAKTPGQKITFFRAYLNFATSDDARRMLVKILRSGGKPIEMETSGSVAGKMPALELPPLKTKDKFDIITRLLILENRKIVGKSDAEELLAELEKTETSDDARRYAYAARAGIGKPENKAKYWNDFTNNKEISESWIEAAFVPFNSIRHSELTLPYLEKALAELPNLKRNRKIFFVNGWLAAFIGGQKTRPALEIVNKFLADNSNLDKDLRLKILENVDVIERAVKIREKFGK
jgi:aminopeptidase N